MSFYPCRGGGGGKLEDHYYIGNWADTEHDRNTVVTVTVPANLRNNKPIRYAFATAEKWGDTEPTDAVPSNSKARTCTITGNGTFTISTTTVYDNRGNDYSMRLSTGTYIIFF